MPTADLFLSRPLKVSHCLVWTSILGHFPIFVWQCWGALLPSAELWKQRQVWVSLMQVFCGTLFCFSVTCGMKRRHDARKKKTFFTSCLSLMSKACHWNCCSIPCWPQRETLKLRDVVKGSIERKTSLWASTLKQYLLLLLYCFVCIFCCLSDFCVVECSLFYWRWWSRVVACINTRGHPKGTQLLLSHVFTSFFFIFYPSDKNESCKWCFVWCTLLSDIGDSLSTAVHWMTVLLA